MRAYVKQYPPAAQRGNLGPWERPSRRSSAEAGRSIAARHHFAGKRSRESLPGRTTMSVIVVGDNCVSESGLAAIVGRDKRYQICGSAHGFLEAGQLIRQHRPDILLIEPFLEDRDGILWIKELA